MALSPGTRLGPYEITAQIGVGGMGDVIASQDSAWPSGGAAVGLTGKRLPD